MVTECGDGGHPQLVLVLILLSMPKMIMWMMMMLLRLLPVIAVEVMLLLLLMLVADVKFALLAYTVADHLVEQYIYLAITMQVLEIAINVGLLLNLPKKQYSRKNCRLN